MNITYLCSKCESSVRVEFASDSRQLCCPACGQTTPVPKDGVQDGQVHQCLVCPSVELFVRKDFPQRLGMMIIVAGFIASTVAWFYYWIYAAFACLFLTALIDAFLYIFMGNVLSCYRCHAEYRGIEGLDAHAQFNLEVHERFRQQAARLADSQGPPASGSEDPSPVP